MPNKKHTGFTYSNLHGQPIGDMTRTGTASRAAKEATAAAEAAAAAAVAIPQESVERVFDALALAGWRRGKTALVQLLRALDWRRPDGALFTIADVTAALHRLLETKRALRTTAQVGEQWEAPAPLAEARLGELLGKPELSAGWKAWLWVADGATGPVVQVPRHFAPRSEKEAQAIMRWVLVSGVNLNGYRQLTVGPLANANTVGNVLQALAQLLRMGLFDRCDSELRWTLLATLDRTDALSRDPALMNWAQSHIDQAPVGTATGLRLRLAERCLQRGDGPAMLALLDPDPETEVFRPLFRILLRAVSGAFGEVVDAFPAVWKTLTQALGMKRDFATDSLLQWYPLSLMSQADPTAWQVARKFCVSQSGSRKPAPDNDWGRWAHALAMRLGDEPLDATAFGLPPPWESLEQRADRMADRVVLAAWIGTGPDRVWKPWPPELLQSVCDRLCALGLPWKADLVRQACVRLSWPVPGPTAGAPPHWPVSFYAPPQEAWREALAAIAELGGTAAPAVKAGQPPATLLWQMSLDKECRLSDLVVFEPPKTARGKPKLLSLLQLKRMTRLDPRDAAVARSIRQGNYGQQDLSLDLVQAAQALVGHPSLRFDDAPDTPVELVETLPVLEVRRETVPPADSGGDAPAPEARYVFKIHDGLLAKTPPRLKAHVPSSYELREAEIEKRNTLRIFRDGPERARMVRVTPAQRRVAELVSQHWTVPLHATAELDAALRVLSTHFVLHSDADAGDPVPPEPRLIARLNPQGEALQLRLLVRPMGDFGPVAAPGQGRRRMVTAHRGLSLQTDRDLDAERRHLAEVLERLPFLAPAGDTSEPCAWLLEEPEQALAAVHELGQLAKAPEAQRVVLAVEWPQGKPVRVLAPDARSLASQLSTKRGWFELQGELTIDEGRVVSLQQLLGMLRDAQGSRYVALGAGQYLRLADGLRQRLIELDALAEQRGETVRVAGAAGAWLADAAPELGFKGDAAWRRRAADLARAAELAPTLPSGFQAELRPYQLDGYVWMRRLAEGGFGAILADDMGLGKTIQTLALLAARAAGGPALVVAPTSVCDNWVHEASRFAPALRIRVYGRTDDGPRMEQLAQLSASDVLVVSYALLSRDANALSARPWQTLVLDEAQALKNASTLRVQAVAQLGADFRLALSGTPVENRLSDLWSLMNLINPGLLGSAARFAERFGNPIERERDEAVRSRLRRLVAPFLLRRTKAQVLADLPPRTELLLRVEPDLEEQAFLEAMRREALARIASLGPDDAVRNRFNVLAELTRLRRAACDPRLVAPELGRVGSKLQAFERLAGELVEGRHKALVFSQFTDFLKLLAERLDAAGLRYQYLDGSTPAAARSERVAAFQRGDADLFLISLKAGGFGLNLTAADYVVITDPWWNPAAEDQAMGRAHRMGQQRPVTVYRLVTSGSIEERIVALHEGKRSLAEGLLADQDGTALWATEDWLALLGEQTPAQT